MNGNMQRKWCCIIVFLATMFGAIPAQAQHFDGKRQEHYGYGLDRNNVFFNGQLVVGVDRRSFTYLGYGYAKDRYRVFYKGKILPGADPRTFKVVGDEEYDDVWQPQTGRQPYDRGGYTDRFDRLPDQLLPGNSLGQGYSQTPDDVFFNGRKIEDAMKSTFQVLKDGYARDAFNVYYMGTRISDAMQSTFRVMIDGYAKDAFNVYFWGRKIPDCHESTFECMGNGVAKDAYNKFYMGRKIEW